ncbi:hypothetical protein [Nakamurella sp.]|uniref:hypothetical protein n=1 Tax=Nakamurella sp. TaxID=1869182 RepID=UPI003B3A9630
MNGMYTITITLPRAGSDADAEVCERPDVESTVDALGDALAVWIAPGRTVRWEIGCPSGRDTAGQITIHDPANTEPDVHRHLQSVRQVLTEEATDAART